MSTLDTFKVYDDEFQSGITEVLMQQTDAFNGASAGTINLVPAESRGNFAREAFFLEIENLIRRRNPSGTGSDTDDDLAQDELVMPKLARKYQVKKTLDAFRKILTGPNPESQFSITLGEQVAKSIAADYLNTGLAGLVGAIEGNADIQHTATSVTTYQELVKAIAKFGDAGQSISAWVMHSKPFYDLLGESVGIATDRIAGAAIYEGTAGTLGRPVIVTDSPSLVDVDGGGSGVDHYRTFGLQSNALTVMETEGGIHTPVTDLITGEENLAMRIQGEHSFNLRTRGYSWNDAITNPTDTQLLDDANFTKVATSDKSTAGVLLISE